MNLEISPQTESRLIEAAHARGMSVETYLQRLLAEDDHRFTSAVEQGLRDIEAGRTRPAREALAELGSKLAFRAELHMPK